jgi:hypothetical protein
MTAALGAAACGGQRASSGLNEPFQVIGGQFIAGDLPGASPPPPVAGEAGAPSSRAGLAITAAALPSLPVPAGAGGVAISGRATYGDRDKTAAVGVRFADMGTGYWVVPVAAPDVLFPGEVPFSFTANFNATDPPGRHALLFVPIDGAGHAGTQGGGALCLDSPLPDNQHACFPGKAPPAAVISMRWDADFDLDLHVVTPDGVDINPKNPAGSAVDAGAAPSSTAPRIDRDSLAHCVPDGLRQEDLVFPAAPVSGNYLVYADPFDACGQPAVRFTVTIYTLAGTCPACQLVAMSRQSGELLASQVTGGASTGLFVTQATCRLASTESCFEKGPQP